MKFLIMLVLSVSCLDLAFARPSFKGWLNRFFPARTVDVVRSLSFQASTVTTPAFDAQRVLRDNLINKLPPTQLEILFSMLENRVTQIGRDESIPNFMEMVATRQGYEQLLNERRPLTSLDEEKSVFGLDNLWKVNLHEVMPQTAALTDTDYIVSAEHTQGIGRASLAVLSLVAAGYEDVIEVFKNSDHTQIRDIFFRTFKNLQLRHGKKNLARRFSTELHSRKKHLQDARKWLESPTDDEYHSRWGGEITKEELTSLEIPRLEKEIAAMEDIALIEIFADKQAAMKMLEDKADAISSFMANSALWGYDKHVEEINSDADEYIEELRKTDNRVKLAAIADLGLYGWHGLYALQWYSMTYYNFFEFLAQEVAAISEETG